MKIDKNYNLSNLDIISIDVYRAYPYLRLRNGKTTYAFRSTNLHTEKQAVYYSKRFNWEGYKLEVRHRLEGGSIVSFHVYSQNLDFGSYFYANGNKAVVKKVVSDI